ncbi:hypothetical protein FOMA001_g13637 [Fusarium oxysporum f. sp. matthiolae]|nr:hypothetical protein FOMA001_g17279 [Fusarium oxysporum f. sp. matthiolae]KAH7471603.1 hypothetical protein FOMA001_g13637 [Fusarium oxysporum f. sp. matthiolae]
MSLSKPQKEGLTATLSKPEDFLNWEHEFLLQAHRLGLQQHLKSKTFLGDEPAIPDIRKRRYTKTATAQRTIRSHTAESQDGTPDDIQETVNGTWSISDLTDQGQKIFQQDLTFYQLQEKIFEKQKNALGTLQDWVIRTVSPSLIQTCCQSHESIYEWHRNLRARCGRTEADETKDARNRYLTLLRTAPKTVSQAAFKWLDQWEEAMAKGRQREVPETLHNSAWAWDFFSVTTHILPSWTASYKISSKTLLQNRALSYRDVGNAFRNELQDAEATKGRVARGAFSASYAGEDPQDDEGDARIIEGQYPFSKKGERKRQRSPEKRQECPACGLSHELAKCFYVFPNQAWKGFKPREKFQKKVKEALEEDSDLEAKTAFAAQRDNYPLRNSVILDPGATISITNSANRLARFQQAIPGDFIWAGDRKLPILGYGTMTIRLTGTRVLMLEDVAYCPRLLTTLVSLRQLRKKGFYWDNRRNPTTLRRLDRTIACTIHDLYGQYVIEYQSESFPKAAFAAHRFSSHTKRAPLTGEAIRWHSRLGHPGPQALEHLISASQGVRIRGPTTVECDACGISKIKRQIRRAPRQSDQKAGERIAIDFHDYQEGIGGYTSQMLLTCRATGYIWDYYLTARTTEAIITAFKSFLSHLEVQHGLKVKVIECDNEITETKPKIGDFLRNRAIIIEPSAPYTQAQNGGAERSGGVVKDKERAMRTGAKLPHQLWPEIGRTAVYLYNRTPNYASGWKTPYDQLHTASAKAAGIPQPKKQPDQTHLRAFGCKAYVMTSDAQQKVNRKMRLKPKGWIGFLVGYRSSNIYRIWIPTINRIVNTRDVIFNEDEGCNGDWESFKDELLEADLEEIAKFVQGSSLPEQDDNEQAEQVEDCIEVVLPTTTLADENSPITDETEDCIVATALENSLKQLEDSDILPTPPVTPLSALLAHSSRVLSDEGNKTVSWQAAFLAGTKSPLQTSIERKLRQGVKMHRNSLPPPPTKHQDLKHHPFGMLFQEAEESHLQSHKEMRSWTEIRKKDARAVDQQVLGCMWVYVYKFDKHGRFQKCKARLVVRGDQQAKGRLQETYAATLAGRSFRTLIAIAARFDLEMVQYDVVNAFVNAPIDQDIFMHMAPGYKKTATILKLNKALYGLRASPLLWQKELSKTLLELGYTQIPHEPCCFKKEGVLFFFYVDDVIIAYRKARKDKADELTRQLGSKYKLTGGDPVQWFLGMEVIRDRPARKIWLSQTAYIDKIANLANKGTSTVPMTQTELRPQTGLATPAEIQRYQRKVGSILYIAVNTRPDIAFAASRLARFLVNPGQEHQDAADRVIHYLSHTRHRALRFGGPGGLTVASDASFADNTLDRKSSQAYTIRLFDGLIGWRASKQNTVTTSTTEAELLALAQAAKESLYVSRLLKELTVQMDDPTIRIDCDNTQTINLVTAEIATLKTKLRHVDIHNHWLRQEVQRGRIQVNYTKSTDMIADGLTKALPAGKWSRFLYQLGLEDIQERQQQSRKQEGIEARLQKTEDCLGNAGSTGTY